MAGEVLGIRPVGSDQLEGSGGGGGKSVGMGRRGVILGQVGEGEGGLRVPGHEFPAVAHETEEGSDFLLGGRFLGRKDAL